jgi:hypothetical protein
MVVIVVTQMVGMCGVLCTHAKFIITWLSTLHSARSGPRAPPKHCSRPDSNRAVLVKDGHRHLAVTQGTIKHTNLDLSFAVHRERHEAVQHRGAIYCTLIDRNCIEPPGDTQEVAGLILVTHGENGLGNVVGRRKQTSRKSILSTGEAYLALKYKPKDPKSVSTPTTRPTQEQLQVFNMQISGTQET